jgi:hypothetical protein
LTASVAEHAYILDSSSIAQSIEYNGLGNELIKNSNHHGADGGGSEQQAGHDDRAILVTEQKFSI